MWSCDIFACTVFTYLYSQIRCFHIRPAGVKGVVPSTWPPHQWLYECIAAAYDDKPVHGTYFTQLDAFCGHQGWKRSGDEKRNKLQAPEQDDYLKGLTALLTLQFYDVPASNVRHFPAFCTQIVQASLTSLLMSCLLLVTHYCSLPIR